MAYFKISDEEAKFANSYLDKLNFALLGMVFKKNHKLYSKEELALHYKRIGNKETFTWYLVKIGNSTVRSCKSNQTGIFYKIKNYNERIMRYYSKVEIIRPLTKWDW
jgi:hypothetical protein